MGRKPKEYLPAGVYPLPNSVCEPVGIPFGRAPGEF